MGVVEFVGRRQELAALERELQKVAHGLGGVRDAAWAAPGWQVAAGGAVRGAPRSPATLPTDRVTVLVIDEVPYLMDAGMAFEGMLQRAWDRGLETKPVLLILIGSDLSMMEALNSCGRTFHQRAPTAPAIC